MNGLREFLRVIFEHNPIKTMFDYLVRFDNLAGGNICKYEQWYYLDKAIKKHYKNYDNN